MEFDANKEAYPNDAHTISTSDPGSLSQIVLKLTRQKERKTSTSCTQIVSSKNFP